MSDADTEFLSATWSAWVWMQMSLGI